MFIKYLPRCIKLWLLTTSVCLVIAFPTVSADVPCTTETDFVTMNQWLAKSDSVFETTQEHVFEIHNQHKLTVTGFDSTRAVGLGFRCFERCSLGEGQRDKARAIVSDLKPGGTYRFRLWQYSIPEEPQPGLKNEIYINGVRYKAIMGDDMAAYGYAEATEAGEIEVIFIDNDIVPGMGFSQINVARVCGCGTDKDCPGGELCEGSNDELEADQGVCTIGVRNALCADQDYRGAEWTCLAMSGLGYFAGEAWCTGWPTSNEPLFKPMEMCCVCSAGLSYVKEDYQHDNGGYEWRNFGNVNTKETSGEEVLEIGEGHMVRGIMVDAGFGGSTPKQITVSAASTSQGPWTKLDKWKQDKYERVWVDFKTSAPFLQLSWDETYNGKPSKLTAISVKLGDRAGDIEEPADGWSGKFSLLRSNVNKSPKCVIKDGCVTSPDWPKPYPATEGCKILVEEDTVLIATDFEVASTQGGVWDDYLVIDSSARRSSGLFTNSAGPYHIPVLAGDSIVWVTNNWEQGTGFRICGYTPDDGDKLPMWPPKKEKKKCRRQMTKNDCKATGCVWNKSKSKCNAKPMCSSISKKNKCNGKAGKKLNCKWNKYEEACQAKSHK